MLLVMTSWACFYNTMNEPLHEPLPDAQSYRNPGVTEKHPDWQHRKLAMAHARPGTGRLYSG